MYFRELQAKYSCPEYHTDALKSCTGVAYAALGPSFSELDILHAETSIFTAEAYAVLSVKQTKEQKALIFTDSFSGGKMTSALS